MYKVIFKNYTNAYSIQNTADADIDLPEFFSARLNGFMTDATLKLLLSLQKIPAVARGKVIIFATILE